MDARQRHGPDWKRDCAVVIPCFNESARIADVVSAAREHLPRVIVVDDGSTDDTGMRAERAGAQVVRLPGNLGKGGAMQTGFRHARELGCHWALTMDGDGQHAASDIPKFLRCAESGRAALIVGDRLHSPQQMPFVRRWTNRCMTAWLSRLAGVRFSDSQCGFRLVSLKACEGLALRTGHFETESEMLLAMIEAGHRVDFVPVQVIYNSSASKIHPVQDTWRWLRWCLTRAQGERVCPKTPPLVISAPAK